MDTRRLMMRLERIIAAILVSASIGLASCAQKGPSTQDRPSYEHSSSFKDYPSLLDDIQGIGWAERVIAIDKEEGRLSLYEKKADWKLIESFAVTTGKNPYDKHREGDMATPECSATFPYKIKDKMSTWKEDPHYSRYLENANRGPVDYGTHVLKLDYPNEEDRKQGKTGGGIWIHKKTGKGYTAGCITSWQHKVRDLYDNVYIGTKVLIKRYIY